MKTIHDAVWNTYIELGSTAYEQGHFEMADLMLEAALEEAQRLGHKDSPLASVFNKLAYIYYQQNNYKKAEAVYKQALTMYERVLGEEDPHYNNILVNLAELYFSQKKYNLAAPLYERSLALDEQRLGPEHKKLERRLLKLAWIYCNSARYDEAHKLYKQARIIKEKHSEAKKVQFFQDPVPASVSSRLSTRV